MFVCLLYFQLQNTIPNPLAKAHGGAPGREDTILNSVQPEVLGRRTGTSSAPAEISHGRGSPLPEWAERRRVISLKEASRLSSLSEDTIRRRHADKIIKLSPRRCGMHLEDALSLTNNED
jgi:hypothetical protein